MCGRAREDKAVRAEGLLEVLRTVSWRARGPTDHYVHEPAEGSAELRVDRLLGARADGRLGAVDRSQHHLAVGVAAEPVLALLRLADHAPDRGTAHVQALRRVEPLGDVLADRVRVDDVRTLKVLVAALIALREVLSRPRLLARAGVDARARRDRGAGSDRGKEELAGTRTGLRKLGVDRSVLAADLVPVGVHAGVDSGELGGGQLGRSVGDPVGRVGDGVLGERQELDAAGPGVRVTGGSESARGPGEVSAEGLGL